MEAGRTMRGDGTLLIQAAIRRGPRGIAGSETIRAGPVCPDCVPHIRGASKPAHRPDRRLGG